MAFPSDAAHGRGHVSRSGGGMKTTNKPLGSPIMNKQLKKQLLATAIAAAGVMPMLAYAQAHSGHAGHISEPSKTSTPAPASSVDHDSMNMSGMHHGDGEMDHGDMQMQGGSAQIGRASGRERVCQYV